MKKDNLILKLGVSIIIFNLFSSSAFAQTKALVTADILNVRTSPQINSEIIGKIPKGEFVTVLESGEWSKIDYYSQEAYVSSQYLTYQGNSIDIINDVSTQTYFEETYFDDLSKVLFDYNASNSTSYNLPKEVMDNTKYTELMKSNPLFEYAFKQLDKPYVYSMAGPESFDCSGFTYYIYKEIGIKIPRTSEQQSQKGINIDKSSLMPGDLVFFDTRSVNNSFDITDSYEDSEQYIDILFQNELSSLRDQKTSSNSFIPEKVTHVGMYIGDNKFIHASSAGKKVIISDLTTGYYKTRYLFSKRYL